jgi:hypothetical protein
VIRFVSLLTDEVCLLGAGDSPNMSQVVKNSKPTGSDEPFDRQPGMAASVAADCNDHLKSLHRQLIRVLKTKPATVPPDAGE